MSASDGQFSDTGRRADRQRIWPHRAKPQRRARLLRRVAARQRRDPPARPLVHAGRHACLSQLALPRAARPLHADRQVAAAVCNPGSDGVRDYAHGVCADRPCALCGAMGCGSFSFRPVSATIQTAGGAAARACRLSRYSCSASRPSRRPTAGGSSRFRFRSAQASVRCGRGIRALAREPLGTDTSASAGAPGKAVRYFASVG